LPPFNHLLRDVQLPGDTSRWDYETFDSAAQRLYIAHLGASQVVVFDALAQKTVGVISNLDGVHGLVLAADLHRLYVSVTNRNHVAAIDTATLQVVATAPTGDYPDGLAYVPDVGHVFVSNEEDSGDTVIDARTNSKVTTVALGSDIGNSQYDADTRLVFVAVGSDNDLAAVDPVTNAVIARYPLAGCDGAHGVQVDSRSRHRVFVACEGNSRLVVLDLESHKVTQSLNVGSRPDVLALDTGLGRLYVAAKSGTVSVIDVNGVTLRKIAEGNGGPDAHSVAVDPVSHAIFLPLTSVGGHPVLRELGPNS
jgi:YVTN family beta-propeller protein